MSVALADHPTLPIDLAPEVVREHGLQVAHVRPLVGIRGPDGRPSCKGRRHPAVAWREYPLLEWSRTPHAFAALALDCDSDKSIGIALDALRDTDTPLPRPNMVIERRRSGHVLAVWTFATPVARGEHAHRAPLRFAGRVGEYFAALADADPGFVSVLCSNPTHADYRTHYGQRDPYELRDLAAVIPPRWRVPSFQRCRSDVGRNCCLFMAGCRYAGNLSRSDTEVVLHIQITNMQHAIYEESLLPPTPLAGPEVNGIIRSILRYRRQWRARAGQGTLEFRERQAARGRASGRARRAETFGRDAEIVAMLDAGSRQGDVAERFRLTQGAVSKIRSRAIFLNQHR